MMASALFLFFSGCISSWPAPQAYAAITSAETSASLPDWIVHWKVDEPPADFFQSSEVLQQFSTQHLVIARPKSEQQASEWLEQWRNSPAVDYIQSNHQVTASYLPNDPLYVKQSYLNLIGAEDAWEVARGNASVTIALVDTGVDLNHPELADNLVPGYNLLNPKLPPQDDNGHGTNVAGIIAALGNNDTGVAGLLWQAKVMPIKALEADGTGNEANLGQGIRYAVDHGAKIVVLSLGLNKYTPYLSGIVQYAEEHDVLLVAASGNEGNAVKYPAAYPTVLAVGGATAEKIVDSRSNFGSELDVVAPWDVFTTSSNGGYEYKDGTSMAAPQVAAVCALAWSLHPDWHAYQIRNLIRQSAEDLDPPLWDPYTGYGMLRADRALQADYKEDFFEPNDQESDAKPLPLGKQITAELAGPADQDWYTIEPIYDGTVTLQLQSMASAESVSGQEGLRVVLYDDNHPDGLAIDSKSDPSPTFAVSKGTSKLLVQDGNLASDQRLPYRLLAEFTIYSDPFENNDEQYMAYNLPLRNQEITGTFDHQDDMDWYVVDVDKSGRLRIMVRTDTARMDLVLRIQREGEKALFIDRNADGASEVSPVIEVLPGKYYIRVANVKDYMYPVIGEYGLSIEFAEKSVDPNEPNDKPFQATAAGFDNDYQGSLNKSGDVDWYKFSLDSTRLVRIDADNTTADQRISVALMDQDLHVVESISALEGRTHTQITHLLEVGDYYVRFLTDSSFPYANYTVNIHALTLMNGFADISDHWAAEAISKLSQQNIISGYGDYYFRPDQGITRAEAAALIAKAIPLRQGKKINFTDVLPGYWGYSVISQVASGGIMDGYPDRSFAPDQLVTRREMAAMMARILQMKPTAAMDPPFNDIKPGDWAYGILNSLKKSGRIDGYADGNFEPDQTSTRAEFATMLTRVMTR
jgi:subtilisin family serine protease